MKNLCIFKILYEYNKEEFTILVVLGFIFALIYASAERPNVTLLKRLNFRRLSTTLNVKRPFEKSEPKKVQSELGINTIVKYMKFNLHYLTCLAKEGGRGNMLFSQ